MGPASIAASERSGEPRLSRWNTWSLSTASPATSGGRSPNWPSNRSPPCWRLPGSASLSGAAAWRKGSVWRTNSLLLTPWWQQGAAKVGRQFVRSEPSHDHPLWLWRGIRPAGNESVRDQDRGPAEDGRCCLSQGESDAAQLSQGAAALYPG